ncbi:unnamed protein product [Chironomus riparius]|nr:unnamed protein product [Chironomus riparius]
MVGILQREHNIYMCGGSLIAENVVLTAAHCLNESNLNDLSIRAGEYDTQTIFELFPHVDYVVKKVVIHEAFYRRALLNDIALLFLEKKAKMSDVIGTICLPSQDQAYDNKNCIATGWGKDKFGREGLYQSILKKIELPTVPFDDCEEKLRETRLGEDFELDTSFMCAGGDEGKDTCKGDGGSPLICPVDGQVNQYYQAGIVAWGIECGKKDVPGVYINVANYRDWIEKQIKINVCLSTVHEKSVFRLIINTTSLSQIMAKLIYFTIILSIFVAIITGATSKRKLCTTFDGMDGKCVPLANCINGTIVKNGFGMIDPRFHKDVDLRENTNGQCEDYLEECCRLNTISPISTIIPNEQVTECGIRNGDGVGVRITGASDGEAEYGEFPWMVALLQIESGQIMYLCGGSLIAQNVVLTAAHCLNESNLNDLLIRAGEYDTQTTDELFPHVDYKVKNVVIHENFNRPVLLNDIALLFLEEKAIMNDIVQTICLPSQDQAFDSKSCIATGWGKDKFGREGLYQSIPKKIELPTVPFSDCEEKLRETRLGEDFELDTSFICAGGDEGKDACKGDGGSPLVCPINGQVNQYYQAGIVAWGKDLI